MISDTDAVKASRPPSAAGYISLLSAPTPDDVPGWFNPTDALLFTAIDELQRRRGTTGDVLEIGVYHGKSAVLLGYLPRADERLVVCDIFENIDEVTAANRDESTTYYAGLRQAQFEQIYLLHHPALPVVHARPSADLPALLPAATFRLVHIDGSHLLDAVRQDIDTARHLLGPGGVVVVDDWSSSHVPGVAMAFWSEFGKGELVPLAFTHGKFYATWSPDAITADEVREWVADRTEIDHGAPQSLGGRAASYISMAPEFWSTYSAALFGSGRAANVGF